MLPLSVRKACIVIEPFKDDFLGTVITDTQNGFGESLLTSACSEEHFCEWERCNAVFQFPFFKGVNSHQRRKCIEPTHNEGGLPLPRLTGYEF